nr:molybdopterin-binding protein [uncultured Litoreibacter sp.]
MKFGAVSLAKAEGGILAHSLRQGDVRLRKGQMLSADDITQLQRAGVAEVVVALLGAQDVEENAAALRVASALVDGSGDDVELTKPFTGRVNVIATSPGIARIEAEAINALNAIDPMITCATVAPMNRMEKGGLLATIKIISYAVDEAALERAEAAARRPSGAIDVTTAQLKSACLIVTETGAEPDKGKGVSAVEARLTALGATLSEVITVPHRGAALADALRTATADLVLILTASATSDPVDVAPQALRDVGGQVDRFGMPVDPGNLLFVGKLNGRPVIGLPGCARSPALNGADWVLERVVCGTPVSSDDIAAMGVGGLLKEIPQRPQPRRG